MPDIIKKFRLKVQDFVVSGRSTLFFSIKRQRLMHSAKTYFDEMVDFSDIRAILDESQSTGASWVDYYLLHQYVLQKKPKSILELGSGKTTLIMAHALKKLDDQGILKGGKIFSLEAVKKYYDDIVSLMPTKYAPYVELRCSPRKESVWRNQIHGFHYTTIPQHVYDLVFVDGPTEYKDAEAMRLGDKGACLDLLYVLERHPHHAMDVVIDRKLNSLQAYQSVLPARKVKYDPVSDLGFIAGVRGDSITSNAQAKFLWSGNLWEALNLRA